MVEHIKDLNPEDIDLDKIFLDPNNPRFIEENIEITRTSEIMEADVQSQTQQILEKKYGISALQESIIENGYLPIDRIVVKRIETEGTDVQNYVVLEGNRRIAGAKAVVLKHQQSKVVLKPYVIESLEKIPSLVYTGADPNASWIFQGLRHISGIKDWSAIQKAKLLVQQMESKSLNYSEAGNIFGISRYLSATWARAYFAYNNAKSP